MFEPVEFNIDTSKTFLKNYSKYTGTDFTISGADTINTAISKLDKSKVQYLPCIGKDNVSITDIQASVIKPTLENTFATNGNLWYVLLPQTATEKDIVSFRIQIEVDYSIDVNNVLSNSLCDVDKKESSYSLKNSMTLDNFISLYPMDYGLIKIDKAGLITMQFNFDDVDTMNYCVYLPLNGGFLYYNE